MKTSLALILTVCCLSNVTYASVSTFNIPYNAKLNKAVEGTVVIDLASDSKVNVQKNFYGADTNGFSVLPKPTHVNPLNLEWVKFGGNYHSVYNWDLNLYLQDQKGIVPVYSPLADRIQYVQNAYKATPLFQVNMLGMQPDHSQEGFIRMRNTADEKHAANAIKFINGQKKLGLQHILMGNEPFHQEETHGVANPSADEYIEKYIRYAVALREAQESISGNPNDIKLWGPEIATGWTLWQTNHPRDCNVDWNIPSGMDCSYGNGQFKEFIPYFLSKIAEFEKDGQRNPRGYKMLDYLSWHYYPLFRSEFSDNASFIMKDGKQNVEGMLESVNLWTQLNYINKYDWASPRGMNPKIVDRYTQWRNKYYPSAKLAVTEFGIDSVPNIEYHPIVRPLYLADLMARIADAGVNVFFNSFLQSSFKNDPWGMINNEQRTRLYFVYSLFSNNYLGKVLLTNDNFGDKVNTYSVKTATGTNVILVNKDKVAKTTAVQLTQGSLRTQALEISLPAWSATVLSIPNNKGPIKAQQYGAKEMGIPVQ